MKDYLYYSWNFHGRGGAKAALAMLQRCDLRREARQETDIEIDDPDAEPGDPAWTTGSSGCVRLAKDDPRTRLLEAELRKVGIEPDPIHYRVWSPAELDAAAWVVYTGYTTMVLAGNLKGQQWNFDGACPECGTGAVPVPPLIVKVDRMPKQGFTTACPSGLVIVTAAVAEALEGAGLTGFCAEPVRTPSREEPDDRFRWLRITSRWPAPSKRATCRVGVGCRRCQGLALTRAFNEPNEVHYDEAPAEACDFNCWQGTIDPSQLPSGVVNRPTGDAPLMILSHRAREVLKQAGVKKLKCEPVFIGRC